MATYLQGITDYIPQVQPFAPDFNFYAKSLQFSQGKADAARKQLSNIYGSLLNSPLTREDNTEAREKFFKTIDQDIQRMAGMDLSLQQNVLAAKGVFNQMLDNKGIIHDMVWTKQFQGQQKKSQSFKNCVDPEKCGGSWWEGGDTALQYNKQEFIDASPEDAMGIGVQSYVPYQDMTKMALDLAKEADLNVTVDQVTGQWITTTKNGPQLVGQQLQSLFMGSIGKDPKVKEYMATKASNQRKGYMYANKDQYGSLEAAEQAYLNELTPTLEAYYGKKSVELEDDVEQNEKKIKKVTKGAENALPSQQKTYDELIYEFQNRGQLLGAALEDVKENNGQIEVAKRNQKYTGRQADAMLAGMEMYTELGKAAEVLSYRNYEQTVAVNPYGMEATKQKNRFLLEEQKNINKRSQIKYKQDLKDYEESVVAKGGASANIGTPITDILGGAEAPKLNPEKGDSEVLEKGMTDYKEKRNNLATDISADEKSIMLQVMDRTKSSAEGGDPYAKEDYVNMVSAYIAATKSNAEDITHGEQTTWSKFSSKVQNVNMMEDALKRASGINAKYAAAKGLDIDWSLLSGGQVDNFYEKTVGPMLDRTKGNDIIRDYLGPVWTKNANSMRNIQAKGLSLGLMDKWYKDESFDVISSARANSDYSPEMLHSMESYIDDKGHVVKEDKFISNMVAKGYTTAKARSLFRGDIKKEWNDPNEWGDGTYNTVAAGADAFGTSVVGGLDMIGDIATSIVGNGWIWGDGAEWFENGFDYDSRTDVANWGMPGSDVANNISGKGNPGIHDVWKRAFSKYATPDGDRAWLGMQGMGEDAAMGIQYEDVDPKSYRSNAVIGGIGAIKDGLNISGAKFAFGNFDNYIPGADDARARQVGEQFLNDMTVMTSAGRPMPTITYANIAGGDNSMVAVNYKLNENYRKKYSDTKNENGIMSNAGLSTDGFTVYIPKNEATNLFTAGAKETPLEMLMTYAGEIPYNSYPGYSENFTTKTDEITGTYKTSGMLKVGLKPDGTDQFDYVTWDDPYSTDLNDIVQKYENLIAATAKRTMQIEENYKFQNK